MTPALSSGAYQRHCSNETFEVLSIGSLSASFCHCFREPFEVPTVNAVALAASRHGGLPQEWGEERMAGVWWCSPAMSYIWALQPSIKASLHRSSRVIKGVKGTPCSIHVYGWQNQERSCGKSWSQVQVSPLGAGGLSAVIFQVGISPWTWKNC